MIESSSCGCCFCDLPARQPPLRQQSLKILHSGSANRTNMYARCSVVHFPTVSYLFIEEVSFARALPLSSAIFALSLSLARSDSRFSWRLVACHAKSPVQLGLVTPTPTRRKIIENLSYTCGAITNTSGPSTCGNDFVYIATRVCSAAVLVRSRSCSGFLVLSFRSSFFVARIGNPRGKECLAFNLSEGKF